METLGAKSELYSVKLSKETCTGLTLYIHIYLNTLTQILQQYVFSHIMPVCTSHLYKHILISSTPNMHTHTYNCSPEMATHLFVSHLIMCTKLNLSLLLFGKFSSLYIKLQLHFANKGIDYYISDEINPEQHADMMSNVIHLPLLSSIFPA